MRLEPASRWPDIPWWAVAIVAAHLGMIALFVWVIEPTLSQPAPLCTFRRLTGYPCPSCGSTRMVLALGRGDVATAIACNPLIFAAGVLGLTWLVLRVGFRRRLLLITSARSRRRLVVLLVVGVLTNWAYVLGTSGRA